MKKGAVAGAIVWSAPLLTSKPAFAATAECSGSVPCTRWYAVKFGLGAPAGCTPIPEGDGEGTGCGNLVNLLGCGEPVTLLDGSPPPAGDTVDPCSYVTASTVSSTTAILTYDSGVVPLYLQLKPGNDCYTYEYNGTTFVHVLTTGSPPAACTPSFDVVHHEDGSTTVTATYPAGSGCAGISHVNTYFCV